jgi:hypothetical protein
MAGHHVREGAEMAMIFPSPARHDRNHNAKSQDCTTAGYRDHFPWATVQLAEQNLNPLCTDQKIPFTLLNGDTEFKCQYESTMGGSR